MLMHGQPVTGESQPAFLNSMRIALLIFSGLCVIGIGCSLGRVKPGGASGGGAGDT
jgi:hypothetical protein